MMRMEIALILVLVFVAFIYFGAGRINTPLHKTFSALLAITPLHLAFDAATVCGHGKGQLFRWYPCSCLLHKYSILFASVFMAAA